MPPVVTGVLDTPTEYTPPASNDLPHITMAPSPSAQVLENLPRSAAVSLVRQDTLLPGANIVIANGDVALTENRLAMTINDRPAVYSAGSI